MIISQRNVIQFISISIVFLFISSNAFSEPLYDKSDFSSQSPDENGFKWNGFYIAGVCLAVSGIFPLLILNNSKNNNSGFFSARDMESPMWTTFGVLEASGAVFIGIGYLRAKATYSIGSGNTHKIQLTFDF